VASAELRLIRRRIRSVQSTKKITSAMELIAASRIVRAQARVAGSQPYTDKLNEVIANVGAASGAASHPLLTRREEGTVGVLIVTSDRGLAGAYNSNIIRLGEKRLIDVTRSNTGYRLYLVGKKARTYFNYRGYQIEQTYLGITDTPTYDDARAISNVLIDDFVEGRVGSLEAYTTRFRSALTQIPVKWPLLPIEPSQADGEEAAVPAGYSYEPSPEEILGRLLPRYVEASVFGMLLEASASEHAARRRAMKAATENAEELTKLLTRQANQARQAEITTEISEIVGGAEALTKG
jgi:F-type H+-transporting ATPase subunit gamma